MNINNKKRLMAMALTAVLASPVVASSFALADNATGSPEEQADITNWIANTPQQISNNMAMQHIDTNNLNGTQYIIQWGDTLSGISAATGISVAKLCYDNNIQNANLIYAGDVLILNRNGEVPAGYDPNVNPNVVAQTKVTINNGPTNVNIVVKPQAVTNNDDHSTNIYTANNGNNSANGTSESSSSDVTSNSSTKSRKHHKLSTSQIVDQLSDAAGDDSKLSFEKYDADDNNDAKELDDETEETITKDIKNKDYDQAIKDIQDQLDDDDQDATVYVEYSDGQVHIYIEQNDHSDSSSSSKNSGTSSQSTDSNNDEDTNTSDDDD